MMIRQIKPSDNPALAQIIRASLDEAKLALQGKAYFAASFDNLSEKHRLDINLIGAFFRSDYLSVGIK